jgi:hypothetical protein
MLAMLLSFKEAVALGNRSLQSHAYALKKAGVALRVVASITFTVTLVQEIGETFLKDV